MPNQFQRLRSTTSNGNVERSDSFADNGAVKLGGVLGNFYVNEAQYKASGIFAGSGVPSIPVRNN